MTVLATSVHFCSPVAVFKSLGVALDLFILAEIFFKNPHNLVITLPLMILLPGMNCLILFVLLPLSPLSERNSETYIYQGLSTIISDLSGVSVEITILFSLWTDESDTACCSCGLECALNIDIKHYNREQNRRVDLLQHPFSPILKLHPDHPDDVILRIILFHS